MKILTVQFDPGKSNYYKRLYDVFKVSVEKNIPEANFVNIKIPCPDRVTSVAKNFTYNTEKLNIWYDFVKNTDDDVILTDCDMLCTGNPENIFLTNFDIGITFKTCEIKKSPMNGGIVFVKNTEKAKNFIELWRDVNAQMYKDRHFHIEWQNKYLGMNQAAFGYIYEVLKPDVTMLELPTIKYNAVDCDWKNVNEETYFIHIKSELRRMVLMNMEPDREFTYCMREWYKYQAMVPAEAPMVKAPKIKNVKIKYRRLRRRGRRR